MSRSRSRKRGPWPFGVALRSCWATQSEQVRNSQRCLRPPKNVSLINLRVEPKFKVLALKAAAADRRSLTSFIEKLVVDHCKATGMLKK